MKSKHCQTVETIDDLTDFLEDELHYANSLDVFPQGCIVAIANLTDCIKITPENITTLSADELALGDYTLGRYAWKMTDIKQLDVPIPAKGQQGLWNWERGSEESEAPN